MIQTHLYNNINKIQKTITQNKKNVNEITEWIRGLFIIYFFLLY